MNSTIHDIHELPVHELLWFMNQSLINVQPDNQLAMQVGGWGFEITFNVGYRRIYINLKDLSLYEKHFYTSFVLEMAKIIHSTQLTDYKCNLLIWGIFLFGPKRSSAWESLL